MLNKAVITKVVKQVDCALLYIRDDYYVIAPPDCILTAGYTIQYSTYYGDYGWLVVMGETAAPMSNNPYRDAIEALTLLQASLVSATEAGDWYLHPAEKNAFELAIASLKEDAQERDRQDAREKLPYAEGDEVYLTEEVEGHPIGTYATIDTIASDGLHVWLRLIPSLNFVWTALSKIKRVEQ